MARIAGFYSVGVRQSCWIGVRVIMEIAFFRPLLSSPSQGEERVDVDLKYLKKPPSHDSG